MFGYGYYGQEIFKHRDERKTMTLQDQITEWIRAYAVKANMRSLVVGISGGIDSAVVSALCTRTGLNVVAVTMPIRQRPDLHDLSMRQGAWLAENFDNVRHEIIDLTTTFDEFERRLATYPNLLGLANSRSRLRMVTLYQIAQSVGGLVVGTGNKVEDFGVGFYTKYGDGGVDISPIADCYKTEVWQMGRELGIIDDIIDLTTTFDEFEQRLATYPNLLGLANSRSRLRMVTLYQIAQSVEGIVVGTGNKVEDFGVGFYTKYGDGGVDLSPIADCYKTEVWQMGRELGILQAIIDAPPTDGLWDDGRTDQDQLSGLTYQQLELAMAQDEGSQLVKNAVELERLQKYQSLRVRSLHKMQPIPVFKKS